MRVGQWKRPGDFVCASTRDYKSSLKCSFRPERHFGWTRQMWFKINIKNPFPLRNRVPSYILSVAEVMAPGVHACTRKKQICRRQRKSLQNDSQFYALSPFSCSMLQLNPQKTNDHHFSSQIWIILSITCKVHKMCRFQLLNPLTFDKCDHRWKRSNSTV